MSSVRSLVGEERKITAKLVAYLGEVEERRLHLEAGFPSMFAFCTKELGMSENEAFRRLNAARLGRRFPVVHELLASGAVHLSALELLRERLTDENHEQLLGAVSGKSKTEILALLAARFPAPDVPATIRKLPERGRVEPLSETRYRVEFTASAELRDKLELCRDLMCHANPARELGVVVERAVDLLLRELEKKRLGRSTRARSAVVPHRAKRVRIATATRRQVFERDGMQCTYVSPDGRRCDARAFLELDHETPRALGGAGEPANVRVLCRAHNQFSAEQIFGRERVERCRNFVRKRCRPKPNMREIESGHEPSWREGEVVGREHFVQQKCPSVAKAMTTMQRVQVALKAMGFRDSEARSAVARVENRHEVVEGLSLEQALREALLAATDRLSR